MMNVCSGVVWTALSFKTSARSQMAGPTARLSTRTVVFPCKCIFNPITACHMKPCSARRALSMVSLHTPCCFPSASVYCSPSINRNRLT
ncbi:hypothetical protein BC831DRAFT_472609 [Entophlyctis helioformis]|nr:hypothetical protein BC831DRAFT_472609 [Entophlyctis helioformis]